MELLIIKTADTYIRVKDDGFIRVNLDKASVFPMDRADHVKALAKELEAKGFESISIKKLILTEEEFA